MPRTRPDVEATVEQLLAERPSLHGRAVAEPVNWQLGDGLLRWLARHLPDAPTTLETGCGYSTIAFAALSRAHTVVSPIAAEHDRVRDWCAAHDVDTSHVRFVPEGSERWLPRTAIAGELEPLDVVLVDGDHAYPIPSIDWFYSAGALDVGGLMIVDDVSIRACGDLRRFLEGEAGRWEVLATVDDATIFRKLRADVVDYRPWNQQPWNAQRPSLALRASGLRSTLRLRSRARALLDRSP